MKSKAIGLSVVALPTIRLKGKTYFIDSRLQELRSKVYPPETIEFVSFGELSKQELKKVLNKAYSQKLWHSRGD